LSEARFSFQLSPPVPVCKENHTFFPCRGHSIALDIVGGLAFFHTHNILHMDMKSPNILLNAAAAKIADIGLGRRVLEGETISSESWSRLLAKNKKLGKGYSYSVISMRTNWSHRNSPTVKLLVHDELNLLTCKIVLIIPFENADAYGASVPWCGPEQLLGDPCTPATDMFALGVIMWELCTGQQASPMRNYRAVEFPKEAPEPICQLIRRCMSFEPERRPSASEVHDIINSLGINGRQKWYCHPSSSLLEFQKMQM